VKTALLVSAILLVPAGAAVTLALGAYWIWRRIKQARWNRFRAELSVSPSWEYSERERSNHQSGRSGGRVA
jgi:hypothetical protein